MTDDDRPPSPWGPRPDDSSPQKSDGQRGPGKRPDSPNPAPQKSHFSLFLIGVIVFLGVLIIGAWLLPDKGMAVNNTGGLLYDGLLLAFVGAGLWVHVRSEPGLALRHMATWVIIFGVFALGYSIWSGTGRLGGELDTARGISDGESISFRPDSRGHYFVRAEVNNVSVLFMVDTGATDVALTREDAENIGLPVDRLTYNMEYSTANGVAYGARVKLGTIELGPVRQNNITGSVLPKGLEHSLLGMSFLNNLTGYKVVDGVLTLYP